MIRNQRTTQARSLISLPPKRATGIFTSRTTNVIRKMATIAMTMTRAKTTTTTKTKTAKTIPPTRKSNVALFVRHSWTTRHALYHDVTIK